MWKLIRSSYKYCFPHCSFCEKKMLFNSESVRVEVVSCFYEIWQFIPNTRCHIWKTFLSVLFFCNDWLNLNKDVIEAVVFWPAGLNISFIYKGLKSLKYLNVIELIHCSNRWFVGSQFIFSNSVKLVWVLLYKFRQKRMHLFWSICNFDFNLLFRLGYQAEHA